MTQRMKTPIKKTTQKKKKSPKLVHKGNNEGDDMDFTRETEPDYKGNMEKADQNMNQEHEGKVNINDIVCI